LPRSSCCGGAACLRSPSASAGGAQFTLTVNGEAFTNESVVHWAGSPLTTTYINAGQLTAIVPAANIASAGTVQVGVNDPVGGLSNTLSFTIQTGASGLHTFPAGLAFLSTPTDYTGETLSSIFDAGVTLAVWDPALLSYDVSPTPPADHLSQGRGYWCRFTQTTHLIAAGTDTGAGHSTFGIPLAAGWNMVGDPTAHSVPISALMVDQGGGFVPFLSSSLVSPTVWAYDAGSSAYVAASALDPWMGYWVFANQACTLRVPLP